jgi:hypothetical protein
LIVYYINCSLLNTISKKMGKTYRRGGAERGYSSPGKSLRDKRQRGLNRSEFREDKNNYQPKELTKKYEIYEEGL